MLLFEQIPVECVNLQMMVRCKVCSSCSLWSSFPTFPIGLCSSRQEKVLALEAAPFQISHWVKRLISDYRLPRRPVSGVAAAALLMRHHQCHYWWSNQIQHPCPAHIRTRSHQHLRQTSKWFNTDYKYKSSICLKIYNSESSMAILFLSLLPNVWIPVQNGALTCCKAPPPLLACSVWTLNSDALCLLGKFWPEPLQVRQAPCITHHLTGAEQQCDSLETGLLQRSVSINISFDILPRLVAMRLWLLIDRRILGLSVDEFPPN